MGAVVVGEQRSDGLGEQAHDPKWYPGKPGPKPGPPRINVCQSCGHDFVADKPTRKFCNKHCLGKSLTGTRNPNWRGGVSADLNAYALRRYYTYPEVWKARRLAREAIARGEIIVPTNCTRCGTATKLQAHHPDYSKPLQVELICDPCHRIEHHGRKSPKPATAAVALLALLLFTAVEAALWAACGWPW